MFATSDRFGTGQWDAERDAAEAAEVAKAAEAAEEAKRAAVAPAAVVGGGGDTLGFVEGPGPPGAVKLP